MQLLVLLFDALLLSVTNVLWLSVRLWGTLFARILLVMCLKLKGAKFQRPSAKGTFLKLRLNKGSRKDVRFKRKTGHI